MKFLLSPAKKMRADEDTLPWQEMPVFWQQAVQLWQILQQRGFAELQALWRCNEKIAALNHRRLQQLHPAHPVAPALLSYQGLQYQYLSPQVFSETELAYAQANLRILSGLYGVLRPLDGVVPYRLEMKTALQVGEQRDLYAFWGDAICRQLLQEDDTLIDLASQEYSRAVLPYLPSGCRCISCVFAERQHGKLQEKGTYAKMARGAMARFAAECCAEQPEQLQAFTGFGYLFQPARSDDSRYVFVREQKEGEDR